MTGLPATQPRSVAMRSMITTNSADHEVLSGAHGTSGEASNTTRRKS